MNSIRTPNTSHLCEKNFDHIYEPAEDSFLMIDALELELPFLLSLDPKNCLEMGSGSGIIITACAMAIGKLCNFYAVDINDKACDATLQTGIKNGVEITTFCGDLTEAIPAHLFGSIDILIFNPPYVETDSDEVGKGDLEYTWAGGIHGREVIDRLMPHVLNILSNKGVFYLLVENNNKPQEIISFMNDFGFNSSDVISRRAGPERLKVLKFVKKQPC